MCLDRDWPPEGLQTEGSSSRGRPRRIIDKAVEHGSPGLRNATLGPGILAVLGEPFGLSRAGGLADFFSLGGVFTYILFVFNWPFRIFTFFPVW